MNEFFYDNWRLLVRGFLLGTLFGLIYDVFRFARLSFHIEKTVPDGRFFRFICPKKPIFHTPSVLKKSGEKVYGVSVFIEDILFFVVISLLTVLFFLGENDGEIRIIIVAVSALGFASYMLTFGKLTFLFSKYIIFFARCLLYWIFYVILIPIRFVFCLAKKTFKHLYNISVKRILEKRRQRISECIQAEIIEYASQGLKIFREINNEQKS